MINISTKEDFFKCLRNELVPENPQTTYGLEGFLEYRKNDNKRHPDSMYFQYNKNEHRYEGESITAKLFKKIYGKVEISSDTIFNCWSYFSMFARGRLNKPYVNEKEALTRLDYIFEGYEELRQLFNELADLHHSIANFMPAPCGYNGSSSHDGKGTYDRDNDMPDIYYARSKIDFPYMHKWINENMKIYCLYFFEEYKSPWIDGEANRAINLRNRMEIQSFTKSIKDAITCIKKRAENLVDLNRNKY